METCFLDGYHLAAGLSDVQVTAGLQQNRIPSAPTQGHHLRLSVGPFPHNVCAVFLPNVLSQCTNHHFSSLKNYLPIDIPCSPLMRAALLILLISSSVGCLSVAVK